MEFIKNDEDGISDKETFKAVLENFKTGGLLGMISMPAALEQKSLVINHHKDHFTVRNLDFLKFFPNLEKLEISYAEDLTDVKGLYFTPSLNSLLLDASEGKDLSITDLSPLGYCKNLTKLSLFTFRTNTIQMRDFSVLSQLTKLEHLSLLRLNIEDVSWISSLVHLTSVNLSENPTKDLSPLSALTKLDSLEIRRCGITSADFLSSLKNLKTLCLEDNKITDLSPVRHLQNLEEFIFSNNLVADLTPLMRHPELQCIDLSGNPLFKKDIPFLKRMFIKLLLRFDAKSILEEGTFLNELYTDQ